ncbi:hypothetical protein J2T09_004642 [Neorhizobium huautlense]|uniref:Uncharacterized protein n=1 Tax=Neorhizobium huautlense TaxID=67774 RepID=A0ABT9PZH3_9HYPH|nr:hypothetical protein [Neorhizobium huautlense]
MTIEQAVDQVEIARSATSRAYGQLPGDMGFSTGGKSCGFLMSGMDPFDITTLAQRLCHPVQTVTDDAIYPLHAGGMENLRQNVGDLGFHARLL